MSSYKIFTLLLLFVMSSIANGVRIRETNMVFYVHGKNAAEIVVAGANGSSSEFGKFGTGVVMDVLVTWEPQNDSKVIGKAKGIYLFADASGNRASSPMLITIVFENDKNQSDSYNSLQLQGVDDLYGSKREVSVVGGTGKFRFARGYAIITTETVDNGLLPVLKFDVTIRPL
ncbi:hypothetical protein SUGI_1018120 [Cryptomeria japonica]|uniref:pterocarpan synthase 1 n=1 Tax=Cryptomeria japonica TaxID=3369 RepID=UPI0024148CBB|nr:pterocarpan synthase 1 [Cryptomeria japonica]GLJ48214.1 hypothetical protein SUGI_1018120 [Cryptomeria japonica]